MTIFLDQIDSFQRQFLETEALSQIIELIFWVLGIKLGLHTELCPQPVFYSLRQGFD